MKKIFLTLTAMVLAMNMFSHVYYQKDRWRLLGYRNVEQTNLNNGDVYLNCSDPGWQRCKALQLSVTFPDGSVMSGDDFDNIDTKIYSMITSGSGSQNSKFIFDNRFFVKFSYNVDTDGTKIDIYSMSEAKALGFLN